MEISTDPHRLDIGLIHHYLSEQSYWARAIPRATLEKALRHSLCFGLYEDGHQLAFCRVITDYATYGYLSDVFVLPEAQGRGLGKALVAAVMAHPDLQGLRRFALATSDAHQLYARHGFVAPAKPESLMERYDPDIYLRSL